ncbi:hypothetical protein CMMCAS05_05265 [Clavibacter michiganensis subsp. michiganensis]|nr:hypothetical protein CMMCAS05_05265 [Clavibacter michiganensis subsp. michiganensis]
MLGRLVAHGLHALAVAGRGEREGVGPAHAGGSGDAAGEVDAEQRRRVVDGDRGELVVGDARGVVVTARAPVGEAEHVAVARLLLQPRPLGGGVREGLGADPRGVGRDQHAGAARSGVELGRAHDERDQLDGGRRGPALRDRARRESLEEVDEARRGDGEDDARRVDAPAVGELDVPVVVRGGALVGAVPVHGLDRERRADVHAEAREVGDQRVHQQVHAADDAADGGSRGRSGAHRRDRAPQRPLLGEPGAEAGRDRVGVDLVGVGAVHAGDDGGDQPVDHAVAHAGADEAAERALLRADDGGEEEVGLGAGDAGPADRGRDGGVERVRGDPEQARARQLDGAFGELHPRPVRVRLHDQVREAQLPQERGDGAAAGGEALGAAVEAEAVHHVGSDGAAERGRRLHEDHALPGEGAGARGDEAAHAAADHDDVGRVDLAGCLPRVATHGRGPRCG